MSGAILGDVKTVLEFYQSLGFKFLPVNIEQQKRRPSRNLSSEMKKSALQTLRNEIGDCKRCKLSGGRKNIVFGEGNPDAFLMFIGEGPGEDEDVQARPFVGRAGQTLRNLIAKMGFKDSDVYIANVVKCRPPSNRTPMPDEILTCIPFLRRQIQVIAPRVIMLLGNVALQGVMENPDLRITAARGRFMEYEGILVMPTFHPSYLLRNPKDKWLVWEDAQKVLESLRKDGLIEAETR